MIYTAGFNISRVLAVVNSTIFGWFYRGMPGSASVFMKGWKYQVNNPGDILKVI